MWRPWLGCVVRRSIHSSSHKPLLTLTKAHIPGLKGTIHDYEAKVTSLTWSILDGAQNECWAIIGPTSSNAGAHVRQKIIDVVLGRYSPRAANTSNAPPSCTHMLDTLPREAVAYVPFETPSGNFGGEFIDYTTRYGSIRDEDRVTLFESLMESRDVYTGLVAQLHMRPDPLRLHQDNTGLLKWNSSYEREECIRKAHAICKHIQSTAPALGLTSLLSRPLISLSNGQMRRARILRALIQGAEWAVLEDPFKGLDQPSRNELTRLFGELHANRTPRLCLVLREQDPVPSFITHILRVDEHGFVTQLGHKSEVPTEKDAEYPPGSYDIVRRNAERCVYTGQKSSEPIVAMRHVSIEYESNPILQDVSLELQPGARMVLVGDNGSGKTTLLSLLLGDHPRSFALSEQQLSLWGAARDAPRNAHVLLQRRIGHMSPELFHAFPRKSLEAGGLTVADAIASGFDGIFTYRRRNEKQLERVAQLLRLFSPELVFDSKSMSSESVGDLPFASLTHGSQAVVLFLRALVHRPSMLILDEAFQGMSGHQVAKTRAFIDGTQSWVYEGMSDTERAVDRAWREKVVIVAVSHYESEWPLTCGCLLRLSQGRVIESF